MVNQAPSGPEPLTGRIIVRLRPEVLTTRPHTDLYLRSDFILMCFGNTVETKEIQFLSFSRKIRPSWKKFLCHQLPNMIHTKFVPLDVINKKWLPTLLLKMIGWKDQEPETKLSIKHLKLSIAHYFKACCNRFWYGLRPLF